MKAAASTTIPSASATTAAPAPPHRHRRRQLHRRQQHRHRRRRYIDDNISNSDGSGAPHSRGCHHKTCDLHEEANYTPGQFHQPHVCVTERRNLGTLIICLINPQSVGNKELSFYDLITEHGIDIITITGLMISLNISTP